MSVSNCCNTTTTLAKIHFIHAVAIVAGTVLPWLNQLDQRLLTVDSPVDDDDNEDEELARVRELVRRWKAEAAREGKPLKLPAMPFMLRNIWTASLALFALVMLATFWIRTVQQATVAISLLGVSWACAVWVPFAIIMQFLRELETVSHKGEQGATRVPSYGSSSPSRPHHLRVASSPANPRYRTRRPNERTALIRRHSLMGTGGPVTNDLRYMGPEPVAGGTILGIHNLAIVMPQLLVSMCRYNSIDSRRLTTQQQIAVLASIIFRITDTESVQDPPPVYLGKDGVSWVLRLGGLFALVSTSFRP